MSLDNATYSLVGFQLTRPCGSRLSLVAGLLLVIMFQLTRPCGSRHIVTLTSELDGLFQLTRPCGSRHGVSLANCLIQSFQLTRPCGSRPTLTMCCVFGWVSTHATLRVATPTVKSTSSIMWFQLTRPCGSRLAIWYVLKNHDRFNSRDPAGRDRRYCRRIGRILSFNSRDPAGRDRYRSPLYRYMVVSTHATLRVAT